MWQRPPRWLPLRAAACAAPRAAWGGAGRSAAPVVHGRWTVARCVGAVAPVRHASDTIYALISGRPPCAVSIVRVSGAQAPVVYDALCDAPRPPAHRAARRTLYHPTTHEELDDALVLWFPERRSFTGEATLELHIHGSAAVVRDVLDGVAAVREAFPASERRCLRPAGPGEFTRRAFEHGRMDLASCEALDALLRAETTTQRRLAQRAGQGRQAKVYEELRARLLSGMAQVEAMLDFSDEDGIDMHLWASVRADVQHIYAFLRKELQLDGPPRRTYTDAVLDGTRLVLYGRPNAGKSSLLNRLVRRDAAIVTPQPGTTRDVIEAHLELDGYRVLVSDTAGVREARDDIERMGIERTLACVDRADIKLLVCTPDDFEHVPPPGHTVLSADEARALGVLDAPALVLVNKMDAARHAAGGPARRGGGADGVPATVWHASVLHDIGIEALLRDIGALIAARYAADEAEVPLVTQARHRHLLLDVVTCLEALLAHGDMPDVVLAAEELRRAAYLLGQITGVALSADEVLGEIFGRFCIGK